MDYVRKASIGESLKVYTRSNVKTVTLRSVVKNTRKENVARNVPKAKIRNKPILQAFGSKQSTHRLLHPHPYPDARPPTGQPLYTSSSNHGSSF